jgi:hypothetical protein
MFTQAIWSCGCDRIERKQMTFARSFTLVDLNRTAIEQLAEFKA